MNLGQELDFFMAQGPLFWAAAASVGLGGTLLVSSIFVWLRRRMRLPGAGLPRWGRRSRPAPAKPAIEVNESGYAVEGGARAVVPQSVDPAAAATADAEHLLALLQRLREAGNRLESVLDAPQSHDFGEPGLKRSLEYDETETRAEVC